MNESCRTWRSVSRHYGVKRDVSVCMMTLILMVLWRSEEWVLWHMNESCRTYEWVMSHTWQCAWRRSFSMVLWRSYEWGMSNLWMSHVMHITVCMATLISMVLWRSQAWLASFISVSGSRPIHMCDMTHSYVWHDPFIRVPRLIHTLTMTHSCVRHDSHSYVWLDWLHLSKKCTRVHLCPPCPRRPSPPPCFCSPRPSPSSSFCCVS